MARVAPTAAPRARLVEAFASLQGEGLRVGERQVFLRFAVCDRKCRYCDTPESIGAAPHQVTVRTGASAGGATRTLDNPLDEADLDAILDELSGGLPNPVVSLTGGEPLLQAGFLERWLPPRATRYRFLLETHGLLPQALARVVASLDEVVMDVKVPSATGEAPGWEQHLECVRVAREAGVAHTLKAVVAAGTLAEERAEIWRVFRAAAPGAGRILQPVTPQPGAPAAPSLEQLMSWQAEGLAAGLDVRVVPQVHRFLGIL